MLAAYPQWCPHFAFLYSQIPRMTYRTVKPWQVEMQEALKPVTELCKEAAPRYHQSFGSGFVFQSVYSLCKSLFFILSFKFLGLTLRKVIYLHRYCRSLVTKITQDNLSSSVLSKRILLKAFIKPSPPIDLRAGRQHKWISA